MYYFFLKFFEEEDSNLLMEVVLKEELQVVLHSFQRDENLGLDGWPIEFFIGLSELI